MVSSRPPNCDDVTVFSCISGCAHTDAESVTSHILMTASEFVNFNLLSGLLPPHVQVMPN